MGRVQTELTILSALAIGLVGSTHCIGMCGGIVSAFTLSAKTGTRQRWHYVLVYHVGRIGSYALAGAIVGFIGQHLFSWAASAQQVAHLISAAFVFALGLYLCGWSNALGWLERIGGSFWKRLQPLGRRLLPVNHPGKALLLGTLWGWLPCGLVYAALAWSLSAGSALRGAALMAAFGIGTLPALLIVGTFARWFVATTGKLWVRRFVGLSLVIVAIYGVALGLNHEPHAAHAAVHSVEPS